MSKFKVREYCKPFDSYELLTAEELVESECSYAAGDYRGAVESAQAELDRLKKMVAALVSINPSGFAEAYQSNRFAEIEPWST